jgi:TonB family protein
MEGSDSAAAGRNRAPVEWLVLRPGGNVSLRSHYRLSKVGVLLLGGCLVGNGLVMGQEALTRKVKSQVAPTYPELARRMSISGVVKIQVKVDKSGVIKETKLIGGHPVLANAALDAIKRWKYEPAAEETTGVVEIHFTPNQ